MNILTRNNVRVFGNGNQPMLFAHGFGCDQTMWRYITPAFEVDYRIVLFDYVGCGGSDKASYDPIRYSNLEGYAQDVLDVCKALHLKDVIFVGHSVSGMVGTLAANMAPEYFSRIIMLGPSACYINDLPHYNGGFEQEDINGLLHAIECGSDEWAYKFGPAVMGNPDRPELAAELSTLFCSLEPKIARQFAEVTFCTDSREAVKMLNTPTLIMQCSDDMVAPPAAGEYLHQSIHRSTLARLEAKGHVPQMSAPDETILVMKSYLRDAEGL